MNPIAFDLTAENGTLCPDEVALINTFRRITRRLPTGYGETQFTVKVADHYEESIQVVFEERAIVDENAPTMVGAIYRITSKAT